jgi:hypothetical protein
MSLRARILRDALWSPGTDLLESSVMVVPCYSVGDILPSVGATKDRGDPCHVAPCTTRCSITLTVLISAIPTSAYNVFKRTMLFFDTSVSTCTCPPAVDRPFVIAGLNTKSSHNLPKVNENVAFVEHLLERGFGNTEATPGILLWNHPGIKNESANYVFWR